MPDCIRKGHGLKKISTRSFELYLYKVEVNEEVPGAHRCRDKNYSSFHEF